MNLYRNSNIFILGFLVSDSAVGIYAAAEKVIKAIQSIVSPIAQALFPHLGYKFISLSIKESVSTLINVGKKISMLLIFLAFFTFIGAPFITKLLGGISFKAAIPLIKIMSIVILFGGMNYLFGIVGLINLNKQKYFLKSVLFSGFISLTFLFVLAPYLGVSAAAWSMVVSEILLFISCCYYLYKLYKYKY